MADEDKKQELLPPVVVEPARPLAHVKSLPSHLPGPKKNWLGQVTQESFIDHAKFAIEAQELVGKYAEIRGKNETAEERGRAQGAAELADIKSSIPSKDDVRRAEELKEAKHKNELARLESDTNRYPLVLDDEFTAREFERELRRPKPPPPPPPKDETLPPRLTALGMAVIAAEAARNGTEVPTETQIAAVKTAWNAFEADCKPRGVDPKKILDQIDRALKNL